MNTTFSRQVPGPTRQAEIDWPGQGVLTAPARRHPTPGDVLGSFAVTLVSLLGVALTGNLIVLALHRM